MKNQNTLFDEEPLRKTKIRESNGRFCTERQKEIDRKYRIISKVEHENSVLRGQVEYWRRTAVALQRLFAQHERFSNQKITGSYAKNNERINIREQQTEKRQEGK